MITFNNLNYNIQALIWSYLNLIDCHELSRIMIFSYTSIIKCSDIFNYCFKQNIITYKGAITLIKNVNVENVRYKNSIKKMMNEFHGNMRNNAKEKKLLDFDTLEEKSLEISDLNVCIKSTKCKEIESIVYQFSLDRQSFVLFDKENFHKKSVLRKHYGSNRKNKKIHTKCQKKKHYERQIARLDKHEENYINEDNKVYDGFDDIDDYCHYHGYYGCYDYEDAYYFY